MKTIIHLFVIPLALFGLPMTAAADDVEDVRQATLSHFLALRSNDVEAHLRHHMATKSTFGADGGLLREYGSIEEQRLDYERPPAVVSDDRGNPIRHLGIEVFGNAAVVTGYTVEEVTAADGSTTRTIFRRTALLIKEKGEWKEAHLHVSKLVSD